MSLYLDLQRLCNSRNSNALALNDRHLVVKIGTQRVVMFRQYADKYIKVFDEIDISTGYLFPRFNVEKIWSLAFGDYQRASFDLALFPGLYESSLSGEMDAAIEYDLEYYSDHEYSLPSEIDVSDFWQCFDYSIGGEALSENWLENFQEWLQSELHGMSTDCCEPGKTRVIKALGMVADCLKFEEIQSPKYYNFTTDRLFVETHAKSFQALLDVAHTSPSFSRLVHRRHSSRDGFISHYANDSEDWPREVDDCDHNHLSTLFLWSLEYLGLDVDQSSFEWSYEGASEALSSCEWIETEPSEFFASAIADSLEQDIDLSETIEESLSDEIREYLIKAEERGENIGSLVKQALGKLEEESREKHAHLMRYLEGEENERPCDKTLPLPI